MVPRMRSYSIVPDAIGVPEIATNEFAWRDEGRRSTASPSRVGVPSAKK